MTGKQERQRRRARERYERQREHRLQRQHKIRWWSGIGLAVLLVGGLVAGITLSLVGGSPKSSAAAKSTATSTATATPTASATPSAATVAEPARHCTYTKSGVAAKSVSLPPANPDYKSAYQATIDTNRGKIEINLLNSKATCAVNSFAHLADAGFWNNSQCHRLSTTGGLYMLQCGDPTATGAASLSCSSATLGTGGPGYQFANENLTGATYSAGTVAMANSGGAATNGSQFFLVYKNTSLPADYTPFGTITSGLDILQNVAKAGTSCTYQAGGGVPKEKVIIQSVAIKKI